MSGRETIDYAKPFSQALWFDLLPCRAALPQLPAQLLLHAGPPLRGAPPAPLLNAAIQALLFEGLAADVAAARELILSGAVRLRPAQDHGVVTPLAQVVCASMPLVAVRQQRQICYAPIIEGPAPALRFGCVTPECLRRLRDCSAWIDRSLAPLVRRQPIAVDALIRRAVAAGDECHARTAAANEALLTGLPGLDGVSAAALRASPAFVLSILMAAAAAALRTHACRVEAIGGNGIDFGIRCRGEQAWRQIAAEAPRGTRIKGLESMEPLGAIGDSAVIDFCGLGGQALAVAPTLLSEWREALPRDAAARGPELIDPDTGIVDPQRLERGGRGPLINLAILDRAGAAGLIGRGVYCPPVSLFGPG